MIVYTISIWNSYLESVVGVFGPFATRGEATDAMNKFDPKLTDDESAHINLMMSPEHLQ